MEWGGVGWGGLGGGGGEGMGVGIGVGPGVGMHVGVGMRVGVWMEVEWIMLACRMAEPQLVRGCVCLGASYPVVLGCRVPQGRPPLWLAIPGARILGLQVCCTSHSPASAVLAGWGGGGGAW